MKSDRLTKLCMDYLPMIKSIATKYKGNGVPLEDLIQEGFLGLLEAEKRLMRRKIVNIMKMSM